MSKKPRKVEETKAAYVAKNPAEKSAPAAKPAEAGVRYMDDATF